MAYKVLATLGFFRFHAIVGDFKAVLRRRRESAEISLFCSALPCKVSGRTAVTTSPLFLQKNRARHTCPISSFHQPSSLFFIFANIPKLRPLWVVRVLAWVRPSNRNTGRFWRSTVVIRSASPREISPCRRASRSSTRYRRDCSRTRCGRGRRAYLLP